MLPHHPAGSPPFSPHSPLNWPRLLLSLWLLVALLLPSSRPASATPPHQASDNPAQALLNNMRPEERVGQLFLVTFQGTDVEPGSPVYELITALHVGGVVLRSQNDNFSGNPQSTAETPGQIAYMTQTLQRAEWEYSSVDQSDPLPGQAFRPVYAPLLIGVSQEGDGYPDDQILFGLTTQPNAMALGATWQPNLATEVGKILGFELSSLGINLLFGPSLDVLESPQIGIENNLGTRTFGGDPYWVGEMGRAYVSGVHQGSAGRLALVAKYFPGHGSSDRSPEEEVATVRKSLEELENFDLLPFFAVTGNAAAQEDTIDALLTSHIRYQGLQGNIRATTRPISFDPQALNLLTSLPTLSTWRENGGLMVSDDLGSLAVRRFYELTSQPFDSRRVALNAFLAGNDLLYIADFTALDEPDPLAATRRTLDFFVQKYREDAAFAQRVDASVLRILTLKLRLYGDYTLSSVLAVPGRLDNLGKSGQVAFEVARQSATLISPTQPELDESIPDPPNQNDRIVFISDMRMAQQCTECPSYPILDARALQDAVVRLYGPQAGGLIAINNLSSYTLVELQEMLDTDDNTSQLARDLSRANWIVISLLKPDDTAAPFNTLTQFLSQRPDLFQQKRLIVFAFCAPFYLDATNTSKLTAYYSLYSKTAPFIDVAAYLLFGELRPVGAAPVSVTGIGYDLNQALFPDPQQIIPIALDLPPGPAATQTPTTATPQATPPPEFRVGDIIPLRAGPVLDSNGHPVPDGTPVAFIFTATGEATSTRQIETTRRGLARTNYSVINSGTLEIHVESENARSETLRVDIPSPGNLTASPPVTETPTLTPPPEATQTSPPATPEPTPGPEPENRPGLGYWILALLVASISGWVAYRLSALAGQVRWGVRVGMLTFIGALAAYSYLILDLPGSKLLLAVSISRGIFLGALAGSLLGALLGLTWRWRAAGSLARPNPPEEPETTPSVKT